MKKTKGLKVKKWGIVFSYVGKRSYLCNRFKTTRRNERILHSFIACAKQCFHDSGMVWAPETATDRRHEPLAPDMRDSILVGYCFL